jgi:hypothetical protein
MWAKHLFVAAVAMLMCGGTALSTGSGRAAAFPLRQIVEAVEEVAPALAQKLGIAEQEVEPLLVRQASRLTPVNDAAELGKFQEEWADFEPRIPARDEVIAVREDVPSPYKTANNMLCETTVDLLGADDVFSWDYAMKRVDGQIQQSYPLGKKLAMYNELNEITESFESGCTCRAVAELAVFMAKKKYCE